MLSAGSCACDSTERNPVDMVETDMGRQPLPRRQTIEIMMMADLVMWSALRLKDARLRNTANYYYHF